MDQLSQQNYSCPYTTINTSIKILQIVITRFYLSSNVIVFQDVAMQPAVAELPRTQSTPVFRVSLSRAFFITYAIKNPQSLLL